MARAATVRTRPSLKPPLPAAERREARSALHELLGLVLVEEQGEPVIAAPAGTAVVHFPNIDRRKIRRRDIPSCVAADTR